MIRVVLLVSLVVLELFSASSKKSYILFDTGTSYLFITKDKNNTMSLISDSYSLVKSDGSYCYLPKKVFKKFDTSDSSYLEIPDSFCKDKPPYKNIIKVLNPIKLQNEFWPFDYKKIKPFDIPNDLPEKVQDYLYDTGIIANKTEETSETFIAGKYRVDLLVGGEPVKSRGMCSGVPSIILSMKINGVDMIKDLFTDNCVGYYTLSKIDINFSKKLLIFHKEESYDKVIVTTIKIPFEYFKSHKAITSMNRDDIDKILHYLLSNQEIAKNIDDYYSQKEEQIEDDEPVISKSDVPKPKINKPKKIIKNYTADVYREDCKNGDMKRCYDLGVMYDYGCIKKSDKKRALEFYNKSCEGGYGDACYNLAQMYNNGYGVKEDKTKANYLYSKACKNESGEACYMIGNMYLFKKKDILSAKRFFENACHYGYKKGCFAPMFNKNGKGIKVDKAFLRASCENGQMLSCYDLATMDDDLKTNMEKDSKELISLYQKACDGKVAKSCLRLGILFSNGYGVTKDKQKAIDLYEKTCDMGYMAGCFNLGLMYDGYGLIINKAKAKDLYEKACKNGYKYACKRIYK